MIYLPEHAEITDRTRPALMGMKDLLLSVGRFVGWQPSHETSDDELIGYVLAHYLAREACGRDTDLYKMLASEFVRREDLYKRRQGEFEIQIGLIPNIDYGSGLFQVLTPFGVEPDTLEKIQQRVSRVEAAVLDLMHWSSLGLDRASIKSDLTDETCIDIAIAFRVGLRKQHMHRSDFLEPTFAIAEIERRGLSNQPPLEGL